VTRPWPVKVRGFFIEKNIPLYEREPLPGNGKAKAVSSIGEFYGGIHC